MSKSMTLPTSSVKAGLDLYRKGLSPFPISHFTAREIYLIRDLHLAGYNHDDIVDQFCGASSVIRKVVNHRLWAHLEA
jgi:hypothetical protein